MFVPGGLDAAFHAVTMFIIGFFVAAFSPQTYAPLLTLGFWLWFIPLWVKWGLIGTVVTYIGYGFAMSAKRAKDDKISQRVIVKIDSALVLPFFLLDIALNVAFWSVWMLDFRPKAWLNTLTGRFCWYNSRATEEKAWRLWMTHLWAAMLDGKDPSGDHIKGENLKFKWLD
jgi:hypothetical protein